MIKRLPGAQTPLFVSILFLSLAAVAFAQDRRVEVPNVVGLTQTQAETEIRDAGLLVGPGSRQFSESVPEDVVISQVPAAGELRFPGTSVNLVVSDGPPPPAVGIAAVDVRGLTVNEAQTKLAQERLAIGEIIRTTSPSVPTGYVIDQDPAPGTIVLPGTLVDVLLSMGPRLVILPNLVGETTTAAETILARAGLKLGEVGQEFSNTVELGYVIRQNPAARTLVGEESLIDMTVSGGPGGGLVTVPDTTGMSLPAAEDALLDVSLVVGGIFQERSTEVPEGNVIRQRPAPESLAIPGSLVDLIISTGESNSIGNLENPATGAYKSGIDIVSGWYCEAGVILVIISGPRLLPAMELFPPYHGSRADTEEICGDIDNGFALALNYNKLGDGVYTVQAFADGVEFARRTFTIATLGTEFLRGAEGDFLLNGFPNSGDSVRIIWDEAIQNFTIKNSGL